MKTIEREADRPDQTSKLGRPLSNTEEECYLFICQNGVTPVTTESIFTEIWGHPDTINPSSEEMSGLVWCLISKVRAKLGKEAIITRPKFGYVARRQLIKFDVARSVDKYK